MLGPGDALLSALSVWGTASWRRFRGAVDELATVHRFSDAARLEPLALDRWFVADSLAALGHVDLLESGDDLMVAVAPRALTRLPWSGGVAAVLCGSRGVADVDAIERLTASRPKVDVEIDDQRERGWCVPLRILCRAPEEHHLEDVASAIGARWQQTPAAWSLATSSGGLDAWEASLTWSEIAPLNWEREDFDVSIPRFVAAGDGQTGPIRLSRYRRRASGRFERHMLWHGPRSAVVDPAWGVWLALRSAGVKAVHYDPGALALDVVLGARIPELLRRSLVLCSGLVAQPSARRGASSYTSIPPDVADLVISKLGQHA